MDALGRIIVSEAEINKGETKEILSGSNIKGGIYFVTLKSGDISSKIKVIKVN